MANTSSNNTTNGSQEVYGLQHNNATREPEVEVGRRYSSRAYRQIREIKVNVAAFGRW